MNLLRRRLTTFIKDAGERALKTFAQAVLATSVVTEGMSLDGFASWDVWSVGAAAAVISLLSSLATRQYTGTPNSASLV